MGWGEKYMFPYTLDIKPEVESFSDRCRCRRKNVPDGAGNHQSLYGRYKITSVLKSGGMGCVFKGEDLLKGDNVAIKRIIVHSYYSKTEQLAMRRIHNEADILSRTAFKGISKVRDLFVTHDFETNESAHYLVMNYL
jgi:serine/threonine protein kinase